LVARFIQGSAVCSLIVAEYATIHELYDTHRAIQVLALMGSVGILAPAFGPLLGGLILEIANWRYLFGLLAISAVLALIFLTKWMPESHPKENRLPFKFKNIFLSYYLIIKNKNFMLAAIVLCLIYGGLIAWLSMGPLLITEAYHYSPLMFGFFQALIFSMFILGNLLIKKAMKYFLIKKIILLGLILTLASRIVAFLMAYYHSEKIVFFVIALMFFAFGAALQYGPLQLY
jgi:MFS family permease